MIKTYQKSFKTQPGPEEELPSVALVIKVDPKVLNSHSNLNSQQKFIQYQRWVQDTSENRTALRSHLIDYSVLFQKSGGSNMRYIRCCNIFYLRPNDKKKKITGHKTPLKVNEMLLTEIERDRISEFLESKQDKRRKINYQKLRKKFAPNFLSWLNLLSSRT